MSARSFTSVVFLSLALAAPVYAAVPRPSGPAMAVAASAAVPGDNSGLALVDSIHLVDQNGRAVTSQTFAGRLVLIHFLAPGCTSQCPAQTGPLAALQQSLPAELRGRVLFVSISLDADKAAPAELRAYAEQHHIDARHWLLLAGDAASIEAMTSRFGVYAAMRPMMQVMAPGGAGMQHSGQAMRGGAEMPAGHLGPHARPQHVDTDVWLFNSHGRCMQHYTGVPLDEARLRREIAQLAAMQPADAAQSGS